MSRQDEPIRISGWLFLLLVIVALGGAVHVVPLAFPQETREALSGVSMPSSFSVSPSVAECIRPFDFIRHFLGSFLSASRFSGFVLALPSIAASLVMMLCLFLVGRRRLGKGAAFWSCLVWATNVHVLLGSRMVAPAMLAALCQFLGYLFFIEGAGWAGEGPDRRRILLAWSCVALAAVMRGIPAMGSILLGAVLASFFQEGLSGVWRFIRETFFDPWCVLILTAFLLGWRNLSPEILAFLRHVSSSASPDLFSQKMEALWKIYLPTFLVAFWLWHPFWFHSFKMPFRADPSRARFLRMMLICSLSVVFFSCFFGHNLHDDLLASYPGLSLLLGFGIDQSGQSQARKWIIMIQGLIQIFAGAILFFWEGRVFWLSLHFASVALSVAGVVTAFQAYRANMFRPFLYFLRGGLSVGLVLSVVWALSMACIPDEACRLMSRAEACFWKEEQAAVRFYTRRILPVVRSREVFSPDRIPEEGLHLWTTSGDWPELESILKDRLHGAILWEGDDGNRIVHVRVESDS